MKFSITSLLIAIVLFSCTKQEKQQEVLKDTFPDGTEISDWFRDITKVELSSLGPVYNVLDFGAVANDSTVLNTAFIQKAIDSASNQGGGVIVIPEGTFMSGALFFKSGTHLHIAEGGMLKGSNDISNYPKQASRMEGQNLDYFPALVNAYNVNGFTISGTGTIDGNGLEFWKAF